MASESSVSYSAGVQYSPTIPGEKQKLALAKNPPTPTTVTSVHGEIDHRTGTVRVFLDVGGSESINLANLMLEDGVLI